jgi:hypothetical protein
MAQTAINAINLDIAPDQLDKFVEAAKENAAASTKDPGYREFNIAVSKMTRTTSCSLRSMTMPRPSTFTEPRIMSRHKAATNNIAISRPLSEAERIL